MKRRDFIAGLGSAAALPMVARAQQPGMPVIGYLFAGSPDANAKLMVVFRQGLAESGYIEGQNVTIEYRYADGQYDRLSELAADLVRRRVAVIVATPNTDSARAAEAATTSIPILFMVGDNPAKLGLVVSLNRPGGNATGVNYFLGELVAKRLELLHQLVPTAARFALLTNPNAASAEANNREAIAAASAIGVQADLLYARDAREIEAAFATLVKNRTDALSVLPDTFFVSQRVQIAGLAVRHAVPAIFAVREYAEAGGLISYGPRLSESYRQLGLYAARIIKGARPADLPVVQSTKFELVINLKTAKALGLEIPPKILALADEVIE